MKYINTIKYIAVWLWKARRLLLSPLNSLRFISSRSDSNFVGIFRYPGGRFLCRKQDWLGVREIFLDKEYSPVLLCLKEIKAPVVVDLGANIGGFALYMLSHYPDAKVISVEAAPDTFEILNKNRKLSPKAEWEVVHAAVWMENGPIYLDRRSESTGHCVVADVSAGESIPGRTLDDIVKTAELKNIDVLKMDIEGAEGCVIPNSRPILLVTRILIIEVHTDRIDPLPVYQVLADTFSNCWFIEQRSSKKPVFIFSQEDLSIPGTTEMDINDIHSWP